MQKLDALSAALVRLSFEYYRFNELLIPVAVVGRQRDVMTFRLVPRPRPMHPPATFQTPTSLLAPLTLPAEPLFQCSNN